MMKKRQNVSLEAAETNGQYPISFKYFLEMSNIFIT